jgi:hypothetical protein
MQEPGLRRLREGACLGLFKNKVGRGPPGSLQLMRDGRAAQSGWRRRMCARPCGV